MLKTSYYFIPVIVYSSLYLFVDIAIAKLGFIWEPLNQYGILGYGRLLRGHNIKLYQLQVGVSMRSP